MTDLEIQNLCLNVIKSLEVSAKAQKYAGDLVFKLLQKEIGKPKMEIVKNSIAEALTDVIKDDGE